MDEGQIRAALAGRIEGEERWGEGEAAFRVRGELDGLASGEIKVVLSKGRLVAVSATLRGTREALLPQWRRAAERLRARHGDPDTVAAPRPDGAAGEPRADLAVWKQDQIVTALRLGPLPAPPAPRRPPGARPGAVPPAAVPPAAVPPAAVPPGAVPPGAPPPGAVLTLSQAHVARMAERSHAAPAWLGLEPEGR
jgi:hypothetical protein